VPPYNSAFISSGTVIAGFRDALKFFPAWALFEATGVMVAIPPRVKPLDFYLFTIQQIACQ
jgi:hypothetical protein